MNKEKLDLLESKYKLPKGILSQIIGIEEEHQYQLKPKGIMIDIEKIIADYAQRDLDKRG